MTKLTGILCLSAAACLAVGCSANTSDDDVVSESEAALGTVTYQRVTCESWDGRYHTCNVNLSGGRITDVRVVRERSFQRCSQGFGFGNSSSYVWVDRGCEADFEVRIQRSGGPGGGPPGCGTLLGGQELGPDQRVSSCNGRNVFIHQLDGNVVLYHDGRALWATNILDTSSRTIAMQGDGNLVQYGQNGRVFWASNTSRNPGAYLNVQDDCNAVIYDRFNNPLWASNTNGCF